MSGGADRDELMTTVLISDIHANVVALDAVLADAKQFDYDRIVCLGDVATTGPKPTDVLDRLIKNKITCVQGNADAWLLSPPKRETQTKGGLVDRWCQEQLTQAHRDYLAMMPPVSWIEFAPEARLFAFHGSPRNNRDRLLPTTPEEQVDAWLSAYQQAKVIAAGHTHEQFIRRYVTSFILNPGSVGAPQTRRADGSMYRPPYAEYAVIDWSDEGVQISMRRVSIPLEEIVQQAYDAVMPHADWWVRNWHRE